jgi:hypothetical protein
MHGVLQAIGSYIKLTKHAIVSLQSMITCHDHVAGNCLQPMLPEIPYEVDEDDDATVKVIRLVKSPSEPLVRYLHIYFVTDGLQKQLN